MRKAKLYIRVNQDELDLIARIASTKGLSISAMVRSLALDYAHRQVDLPSLPTDATC